MRVPAAFTLASLPIALVAGCNALTGVSDLETSAVPSEIPGSDSSVLPGSPDSSVRDTSTTGAYAAAGWKYQRDVSLTSNESAPLANHAVLVSVPKTFDYSHAQPKGEDLRFTSDPSRREDLPYFVEDWTPGAESHVWVIVKAVPPARSTLHVFYGNAAAPGASSFTATFPKGMRTNGNGAGSFVAAADIDVDWFELRAGDTLTLAAGVPLRISARRILIAGTVLGTGLGHPAGAIANGTGGGPGGGVAAPGSGSGGGGYGGVGGRGGSDTSGGGGAGGPAYGTPTGDEIALGSGGAASDSRAGGAGGGAITLVGWRMSITGSITMNGAAGLGTSGQNGGGGAGGGILIGGSLLDLGGGTLAANGGAGGPCVNAGNDGGGGGAGGRIKVKRRAAGIYMSPTSMTAAPGAGGAGGATTAPGAIGSPGTTEVSVSATFLRGVEGELGAERPAN